MDFFDPRRIEDNRLAEGWAQVSRSVASLLALLGWSLAALPQTGRLKRKEHVRACRILRRAEAMVRRMLVIMARRLPAPVWKSRKLARRARARASAPGPMADAGQNQMAGGRGAFGLADPQAAGRQGNRPPPQPLHQPRIRSFCDEGMMIEITPPRPEPRPIVSDRDRPPVRNVAARLGKLADVVANRQRHVRRMARWLANDRFGTRLPLRLKRLPGIARQRPRKGRYRDPPLPDILQILHDLALRAQPPPDADFA